MSLNSHAVTVTIRYRDTMTQERVKIEALEKIVSDRVDMKTILKRLSE